MILQVGVLSLMYIIIYFDFQYFLMVEFGAEMEQCQIASINSAFLLFPWISIMSIND
jgi:hypothetical protein